MLRFMAAACMTASITILMKVVLELDVYDGSGGDVSVRRFTKPLFLASSALLGAAFAVPWHLATSLWHHVTHQLMSPLPIKSPGKDAASVINVAKESSSPMAAVAMRLCLLGVLDATAFAAAAEALVHATASTVQLILVFSTLITALLDIRVRAVWSGGKCRGVLHIASGMLAAAAMYHMKEDINNYALSLVMLLISATAHVRTRIGTS